MVGGLYAGYYYFKYNANVSETSESSHERKLNIVVYFCLGLDKKEGMASD